MQQIQRWATITITLWVLLGANAQATSHRAFLLPWDQDLSSAFNGKFAVTVDNSYFAVQNIASGQTLISIDNLTGAVFCNPNNPLALTFFCSGPESSYDFDPRVKFDWHHQRWIISGAIYNQSALWIAASLTADPTGHWYVYEIPTCGWDQPALGIDQSYATIIEDECNNTADGNGTIRIALNSIESGQAIKWWYVANGPNWTYQHPTSDGGPKTPDDSGTYTVTAASESVNGQELAGVQIGYFDSANDYIGNWKQVFNKRALGSPLPNYYDAPNAPQQLYQWSITLQNAVVSAWGKQSYIFTGFPLKNSSTGQYSVVLFGVPTANSAGSTITKVFKPKAEVLAVTMHPDTQHDRVVIGGIESSLTVYPQLVTYTWNLKTNTVSGPQVLVAGNQTPSGFQLNRWEEFDDCSDYVNGMADICGQAGIDTDPADIDNPNTNAVSFAK